MYCNYYITDVIGIVQDSINNILYPGKLMISATTPANNYFMIVDPISQLLQMLPNFMQDLEL